MYSSILYLAWYLGASGRESGDAILFFALAPPSRWSEMQIVRGVIDFNVPSPQVQMQTYEEVKKRNIHSS